MDHLAILNKSWKLLDKIITGEKIVESRWYSTKRTPWNKIKENETIYLKKSGEPVTAKVVVDKVVQVNLTQEKVKEILNGYGTNLGIPKEKLPEFYKLFKNKKYCILISLKNPQKIKPFNIDKTRYGMMSAWITVKNIEELTLTTK